MGCDLGDMSGSVTAWLGELKGGDQDAISGLWMRYYERMRICARNAVRGADVGGFDDEDIATMAFTQFAERALSGQFQDLVNRNQLWKLLSVITSRTAYGKLNREYAAKRGGSNQARPFAEIEGEADRKQTPRSLVAARDELIRLLESLGSDELREVALLSMEGYSTRDIAHFIGSTQRTVQRMLVLIRDGWKAEARRIGIPHCD